MDSPPTLFEWLSHPLLLLIVGAIISGYLVPLLTRNWQNHQKELEIKSELVKKISEAVSSIVFAVQFADIGSKSQSQEDFDRIYRQWELDRAIIDSQLRAYFPNSGIGSKWDFYASLVTDFDILTTMKNKESRKEQLEKLNSYFEKGELDINWDSLIIPRSAHIKSIDNQKYQEYRTYWVVLRDQVLREKDDLILEILDSPISLSGNKRRKNWR